jgi:hypothetical protein
MADRDENRYRSRTYWMCWGIVALSFGLVAIGKIDSAGWVTVALGVLGAWQLRRYGDNKLFAENGGGK